MCLINQLKILVCIVILLLYSRLTLSDHENLTDSHYLPGAGPLPVELRFDFNRTGAATPPGSGGTSPGGGSGPGGTGGGPGGTGGGPGGTVGGPEVESYWTIACYPDQSLVNDDPLLCSNGCKVTDKEQGECGPEFHKLFCNCD